MTTMTFDPASVRAWRAQLSEVRRPPGARPPEARPPGARGIVAVAMGWAAYALVWLLAAGLVLSLPVGLVLIALRLAGG